MKPLEIRYLNVDVMRWPKIVKYPFTDYLTVPQHTWELVHIIKPQQFKINRI